MVAVADCIPVNLLCDNWRMLLPSPWGVIALAIVSVICGAVVGGERQRREKPAGLRTMILVCLGSAVFTMASVFFTTTTGDSGRVAAQIVVGIGFLGAGVIMHGRGLISGATTAATIWVTAAIGLVAGTGYVGGALALSILVRLALPLATLYELHLANKEPEVTVTLDFAPMNGITKVRLKRLLADYHIAGSAAEWQEKDASLHRLTLHLRLPRLHLRELLDDLTFVAEVKSIHESKPDKTGPDREWHL